MPALWDPREIQLQLRVWKGIGEETVSVCTGWQGTGTEQLLLLAKVPMGPSLPSPWPG